jgi:plasmid stabilization system protein ParE
MARRRPEVVWSEPAQSDLDDIIAYVAQGRPIVAVELALRFRALAVSLETMAHRGRIPPELRTLGVTAVREVVSAPWRLFYGTIQGRVTVLALVDGRRDIEELLARRLLRPR